MTPRTLPVLGLMLLGCLLPAQQPAQQAASERKTLDLGAGVTLELLRVRAGSFDQHAPGEAARRVTLGCDYWIGKQEITRGQFARFAADAKYATEAERGSSGGLGWNGKALEQRKEFTWRNPGFAQGDDHPVCVVTWNDAKAFCDWLARKSGLAVQLPTEAQWEHACRAGTTGAYQCGDTDSELERFAWFAKNAGDGTRACGGKQPNALGLCDVAGNAFEWCADWFAPYAPGPVTDPVVTEAPEARAAGDKPRRVLRGGSWRHDARNCASGARWRSDPASRSADNGFRVAAPVGDPPAASRKDGGTRRGGPSGGGMAAGFPPPEEREEADVAAALPRSIEVPPARMDGFLGWVVAVVALGVVGLVILVLVARRAATAAGPGQAWTRGGSGERVERAADGAWVDLPGASLPALVTVRHRRRGGEWKQDRVRVTGRHFFYTGYAPDDFEVVRVQRDDDDDTLLAHGTGPLPHHGQLPSSQPDPGGSWSAY